MRNGSSRLVRMNGSVSFVENVLHDAPVEKNIGVTRSFYYLEPNVNFRKELI